jgi:hypothetical protein
VGVDDPRNAMKEIAHVCCFVIVCVHGSPSRREGAGAGD